MCSSMRCGSPGGWFDLAAERLGPKGIRLLAIAGNDDPREIDDVLREHEFVQHVDSDVFEIEPGVEVDGLLRREPHALALTARYDGPEIRTIIEERIARLAAPERASGTFTYLLGTRGWTPALW